MTSSTASIRDRLYAADVGLLRLHTAVAATVTTFLTVAVLFCIAAALGLGVSFAVPGVLVTSIATMALGMDSNIRHRTITMLLMPFPAAIALCLGAWVSGRSVVTALVFLALVVGVLVGSLFGSRGILLGLAAIAVFYGADLAGVPVNDLPVHTIAVVVGAVISAVVLGGVLRERPASQPARMLRSIRVLAAEVGRGAMSSRKGDVRRRLDRVAVAVARTRGHIEAHPQLWPEQFQRDAGMALGSFEIRLEQAVFSAGTGAGREQLLRVVADPLLVATPGDASPDPGRGIPQSTPSSAGTVPDGASVDPPMDALPAAKGGRSQISMAIELLVAAVLAITVSMLIDPERWFWGVLAALVMLFGTSSTADAIGKGARRVIGTAAALPIGFALAAITQAAPLAAIICLLAAMFLQQYLADVAYGWSIFFLTLFLYLLFALTGAAAEQTLEIRLLQTAAGAAVGIAVALLVLPTRSGKLLRGRALDVLSAADTTVSRVIAGRPAEEVTEAAGETHQRFLQLKSDAEASRRGWPLSRSHQLVADQLDIAAVMVLELRLMAADYASGQRFDAGSRVAAARVRRSLNRVSEQLSATQERIQPADDEGQPAGPGHEQSPIQESLRRLQQMTDGLHRALTAG